MGLKNLFRTDKSKNNEKKPKKSQINSKKNILSAEEVTELILLEEEIDNDMNDNSKFLRACGLLSVII